MDTLDRNTLLTLAGRSLWPSVSIYTSADHTGTRTDADRLRLRNLTKQARERLLGDGVNPAQADALLADALDLATDETAWPGGPSGLAYFADESGAHTFWVDTSMPELVVVGDRLYLRPLYSALHDEPPVWALALDSNHTRLFKLDHASIEEVELPAGTALSMADDMKYDLHEESLQYHTVPGATPEGVSPGSNAAMFHGHGGSKDADKMQRQRFTQELSRGVVETIGAQSAEPLVMLGVDYLVEDFRAVTAYSHVAPEEVIGATDYLSPAEVRRKVLAVLAPRLAARVQADVDEYDSLAGTGRVSSDASEIVAAAAAGRVKTLLMDDSSGPWGWFDRETFDVTRLCTIEPRYLRDTMDAPTDPDLFDCGWDLVDLAAAETLRHGGVVRAFRGEESPISGAVAVFRY